MPCCFKCKWAAAALQTRAELLQLFWHLRDNKTSKSQAGQMSEMRISVLKLQSGNDEEEEMTTFRLKQSISEVTSCCGVNVD